MTSYEDLRARQVADALGTLSEHVSRLDWLRPEIERHRRRSLRLLLRVAKENSSWYRERLREIDPATATEADLERIPPMTRDDLMAHWDEIVIYPGLDLAHVEAHVDRAQGDAYLFDAFHAVASGGAAGRRGVFVYDWEGWITSFVGCARWRLRNRAGSVGRRRPRVALVGSQHPAHISWAIHQTFGLGNTHFFPATLPLHEIVEGLNEVCPDVLIGYPSLLRELVKEADAGALDIQPAHVQCSGEPLDQHLVRDLGRLWRTRVVNGWAASECLPIAQGCRDGTAMHLNDDLVIVEPVDLSGRRVLPGTRSAKVYLTNLFNLALPLIRYELTDQVTVSCTSCPCGSSYTAIDGVGGRLDERFVYDDGVVVEPAAIGSVLSREKMLFEYQVVQTPHGAEVRVRCDRNLHLRAVAQRVASALGKRGVSSPAVRVRRVDSFERGPAGKLRRFVPARPLPIR